MQTSITLTVAQGKRLIARAVAQLPEVRQALAQGMLAIGRGTTNGYVAEEILGQTIPKGEYVAGRTLPAGIAGDRLGSGQYADIVLKQGLRVEGMTVAQATAQMGEGDVFIKGGNALNYQRQMVGVLIGHPTGGTLGDNYGTIVSRRIHLIIPIGLEKCVLEDINALSRASRNPDVHPSSSILPLYPITGIIVTEIEAFAILCQLHAHLLAAGGVAGAEGASWFLLEGTREQLDNALALCQALHGEPNMGLKDE